MTIYTPIDKTPKYYRRIVKETCFTLFHFEMTYLSYFYHCISARLTAGQINPN
jgi:hypothetical protein